MKEPGGGWEHGRHFYHFSNGSKGSKSWGYEQVARNIGVLDSQRWYSVVYTVRAIADKEIGSIKTQINKGFKGWYTPMPGFESECP